MSSPIISVDQLKRAIVVAEQIAKLQAELGAILGNQSAAPATIKSATGRKKRRMSPEARARIVAAVKARWARAKKAKTGGIAGAKPVVKVKAKRKISPEARARMVEGAKRRWAAKRAAQAPAAGVHPSV